MSVDVLNRRDMSPDNLVAGKVEDRGNLVPVFAAGCPAAEDDGQDTLLVEAGPLGKLSGSKLMQEAQGSHSFAGFHAHFSRSQWPCSRGDKYPS